MQGGDVEDVDDESGTGQPARLRHELPGELSGRPPSGLDGVEQGPPGALPGVGLGLLVLEVRAVVDAHEDDREGAQDCPGQRREDDQQPSVLGHAEHVPAREDDDGGDRGGEVQPLESQGARFALPQVAVAKERVPFHSRCGSDRVVGRLLVANQGLPRQQPQQPDEEHREHGGERDALGRGPRGNAVELARQVRAPADAVPIALPADHVDGDHAGGEHHEDRVQQARDADRSGPPARLPRPLTDIEAGPVREIHQGEREEQQPQRPLHPAEKALDARGQRAPGVRLDAGAGVLRGRGRGPCRP